MNLYSYKPITCSIFSKHRISIFLWCCVLLLFAQTANGQLTVIINSIPSSTDANTEIYMASSLSNWNPEDENYKLKKKSDGLYQITLNPKPGKIDFKFTQGSWETVEVNKEGQDIPNRTINYTGEEKTIDFIIEGWKVKEIIQSTAAQNVSIYFKDFDIPQLNTKRNIWIYLPPNYKETDQRFPVLYMHDGQNLFDNASSFSREWEVDESLNELFQKRDPGVIVVGIENGGSSRIDEYTVWSNEKYGGGKGDAYTEFIVETLKPYIDDNFRTKSDRMHTGIMGSSLGGLISFYAAIKHQETFGMAGVFSPSFWFTEDIYAYAKSTGKQKEMKFYFLGGQLESESQIEEMDKMVNILKNVGFEDSEIKMVSREDGDHNEAFWAREFRDCYQWLFKK